MQGVLAFFAPCAVALLPGYLAALLTRGQEDISKKKLFFRAILLGLAAMAGIILVYSIGGLLVYSLAAIIKPLIAYVVIGMGALIIILGFFMALGKSVALPIHGPQARSKNAFIESFIFGIAYGIGAFGCLFPLFLLVMTNAIAAGTIGLWYLVAYILGMSSLMMSFFILTVFAREFLQQKLRVILPYITRVSGVILMFAGAYIMYYQSIFFL